MAAKHVVGIAVGSALVIGGGYYWYSQRQQAAGAQSTTNSGSGTNGSGGAAPAGSGGSVSTGSFGAKLAPSSSALAQSVESSGFSLFILAHNPVGVLFNGKQEIQAQQAAAQLWDAGYTGIQDYAGDGTPTVTYPSSGSSGNAVPSTGGCHATVTVVSGNNLSTLATQYGTTVAAIQQANAATYPSLATNPNYIEIGWHLCIP